MQNYIKTPAEIEAMREGGKVLASILKDLKAYAKPGMTGKEIDTWVENEIKKRGAHPSYKDKEVDFPGVICISVNDEIVHGTPKDIPLETGDVVSFDMVITYKGMMTDSAFTMVVGEEPKGSVKHLLNTTERSLYAGIEALNHAGDRYVGDVSAAVEKELKNGKLSIVKELVGHGISKTMHEEPEVPNYGKPRRGFKLDVGDTIAIEPMATLGSAAIRVNQEDGWTICTKDGSLSAHFEHTVLITENGVEILTLWPSDKA